MINSQEESSGMQYLAGIATIDDAHQRVFLLLEEIAELNKDIEHYQVLLDSRTAPRDACIAARQRAIADRSFRRDAIKYIEHWIKAESQRDRELKQARHLARQAREHKESEKRRQPKEIVRVEQTTEEQRVILEQRIAVLEATRIKTAFRVKQVEREELGIAILSTVKASGVFPMLEQVYDLIVRLAQEQHVGFSLDDQALIDALATLVRTGRTTRREDAA